MITSIEVQAFRGVREGRLDGLSPLTILTGPNGGGKSTVLDALLVAGGADIASGAALAVQRHPGTWLGADTCYAARDGSRLTVQCEDEARFQVFLERRAAEAIPGLAGAPGPFRVIVASAAKDGQGTYRIGEVAFAADNRSHLAKPPARGPLDQPVTLVDPSLFQDLGQAWAEVVKAGRRKAVTDLLSQVVPWAGNLESLQESGGRSQLYATGDTGAVPVNLLGDGVAALLHLAIRVAPVDQGLVLVEEPEVFQHPRSLRLTAHLLLAAVERGAQVVLTTHSVELIELLVQGAGPALQDQVSLHNLALSDGRLQVARFAGDDLRYGVEQAVESLR
ncbi:AAA family ATPase [Myxococcota bacterium]|nr:AAA family ATPase [Myxococcota bacterium]